MLWGIGSGSIKLVWLVPVLIFSALSHISLRTYRLGCFHGHLAESAQQPWLWCGKKSAHTYIYAGSVCLSSLERLIISISPGEAGMRRLLLTVSRRWMPFTNLLCVPCCRWYFFLCFTSFYTFFLQPKVLKMKMNVSNHSINALAAVTQLQSR